MGLKDLQRSINLMDISNNNSIEGGQSSFLAEFHLKVKEIFFLRKA